MLWGISVSKIFENVIFNPIVMVYPFTGKSIVNGNLDGFLPIFLCGLDLDRDSVMYPAYRYPNNAILNQGNQPRPSIILSGLSSYQ